MTRYVRSTSGRTIHLSECIWVKGPFVHPWVWAEGKPRLYLADLCVGFGYKACWHCKPFEKEET